MSLSPMVLPQGALYPPNQFGPPVLGWSQIIDYAGGSAPVYVLWYPTASGQSAAGYIQKITYDGDGKVINVQWAVTGTPGSTNCSTAAMAVWANRTTTVAYN
jgi:hypothetical protein